VLITLVPVWASRESRMPCVPFVNVRCECLASRDVAGGIEPLLPPAMLVILGPFLLLPSRCPVPVGHDQTLISD